MVTSPVSHRSYETEAVLEFVRESPVDAQPTAMSARVAALVTGPAGTVPSWS